MAVIAAFCLFCRFYGQILFLILQMLEVLALTKLKTNLINMRKCEVRIFQNVGIISYGV
jgi:hypothetical protein